MIAALPFGPGGLAFIALYLLSLLALGWWGRNARQSDTLQDFYLAGPGVGFAVLLLTLYATQWSGNTLFGYTGKAYKEGFSWLVSLHFMTALSCATSSLHHGCTSSLSATVSSHPPII